MSRRKTPVRTGGGLDPDLSAQAIRELQAPGVTGSALPLSEVSADTLLEVDYALGPAQIVAAWWVSSAAVPADAADFWALTLYERANEQLRIVARISTAAEALVALRARSMAPLAGPGLAQGSQLILAREATGAPVALPAGTLRLLLRGTG